MWERCRPRAVCSELSTPQHRTISRGNLFSHFSPCAGEWTPVLSTHMEAIPSRSKLNKNLRRRRYRLCFPGERLPAMRLFSVILSTAKNPRTLVRKFPNACDFQSAVYALSFCGLIMFIAAAMPSPKASIFSFYKSVIRSVTLPTCSMICISVLLILSPSFLHIQIGCDILDLSVHLRPFHHRSFAVRKQLALNHNPVLHSHDQPGASCPLVADPCDHIVSACSCYQLEHPQKDLERTKIMRNTSSLSADSVYSSFEQHFALTYAHAQFVDYLNRNPKSSIDEKQKFFSDSVESGFSLALEFSKTC